MNPRTLLLESFHTAIAAADPRHLVPTHLPTPPRRGRTLVVGAGKAAAAMALAVEQHWPVQAPLTGIVITRYGHGLPTRRIAVIEAGHPLPDAHGEQAAQSILAAVSRLGADDLLLCLLSGGGSSLLALPMTGVTLRDLRTITAELLRSGAAIQEINTVRKHLSAISGGRLAAACRTPVLALAISDVTGDDPTHIASGPCAPDPTTYDDALAVLERYRVNAPVSVLAALLAGSRGELAETPKPGDPVFGRVENRVIGRARDMLAAAGAFFRNHGIRAVGLGDAITGEARTVARQHAGLAREIRCCGQPWQPPVVLVSGGETTVTVSGSGHGGRNAEYLLALAIELSGADGIHALACDTDGIDGSENNAGAIIAPDSLYRAGQLGLDAAAHLANNDSYPFFERLGDLVVTGPTRTNVNDYRAILVL